MIVILSCARAFSILYVEEHKKRAPCSTIVFYTSMSVRQSDIEENARLVSPCLPLRRAKIRAETKMLVQGVRDRYVSWSVKPIFSLQVVM